LSTTSSIPTRITSAIIHSIKIIGDCLSVYEIITINLFLYYTGPFVNNQALFLHIYKIIFNIFQFMLDLRPN